MKMSENHKIELSHLSVELNPPLLYMDEAVWKILFKIPPWAKKENMCLNRCNLRHLKKCTGSDRQFQWEQADDVTAGKLRG